jgi:hypothetical protein
MVVVAVVAKQSLRRSLTLTGEQDEGGYRKGGAMVKRLSVEGWSFTYNTCHDYITKVTLSVS